MLYGMTDPSTPAADPPKPVVSQWTVGQEITALTNSLAATTDPAEKAQIAALLQQLAPLADSDGDGKPDAVGLSKLFHKNGEFSKTAVILVLCWFSVIATWVFLSLFHGTVILLPVGDIVWTIPAFDLASALALLAPATSLYYATHNIKLGASVNPPTTP